MSPPASPRQVVLGLLVIGQLVFLFVANFLGFYHDARPQMPDEVKEVVEVIVPGYASEQGHAWKLPEEWATVTRRWSQLTGQDERWSLFAPGIYKVTGFPAVALIWQQEPTPARSIARRLALQDAPPAYAAGPALAQLAAASPYESAVLTLASQLPEDRPPPRIELMRSENEPADRRHFVRVGNFRLRRLETSLIPYLYVRSDESYPAVCERWTTAVRDHVNRNAEAIYAYMRWRLAQYQAQHPDEPQPQQVLLVERVHPILSVDDESGALWAGPTVLPLVRWRLDVEPPPGQRSIECYNPVSEEFESLAK
jgi:hypothetical protein